MLAAPNSDQLKTILRKATLAPSGDNAQPWNLHWNGQILAIHHNKSRAQHPLDPKGAVSIMTLGCLIESIAIAAKDFQLKASVELNDLVVGSPKPWADVRFEESPLEVRDPLSPMLELRSTDRRLYQKGKLPTEWLNSPEIRQGRNWKAQLHFNTDLHQELLDYMLDAEAKLIEHPTALIATLKTIRLSRRRSQKTHDGLYWRNLQTAVWELPLIVLIRNFPIVLKALKRKLKNRFRHRLKSQIESSAGLFCISIPQADDVARATFEAGRLAMRTWLFLTSKGYGAQPLSFSSCPLLYAKMNALDSFFEKNLGHLKRAEEIFRKHFSIPEKQYPIWVFRTGVSSPLPLALRTPRRPLAEVLSQSPRQSARPTPRQSESSLF